MIYPRFRRCGRDARAPSVYYQTHSKRGGRNPKTSEGAEAGSAPKIHLTVDKRGKPLRFILTGGERNDITQSDKLIEGLEGEYVIADKGYDSDKFVELIEASGMKPVIPLGRMTGSCTRSAT